VTGVGRYRLLDPAMGEHRVVLRMAGVHEVHRVVLALVFVDFPVVIGEELSLRLRVGFTWNHLRLLVDVAQAVQYRRHAALGIDVVKQQRTPH